MVSRETPAEKLFMALVRRWCTLEHPELLREVVGAAFRKVDMYSNSEFYIIRQNLPVCSNNTTPEIPDIETPKTLEDLIAMGITLAVTLQLSGTDINFKYGLYGEEDCTMKPAWAVAFYLAARGVMAETEKLEEKEAKNREKRAALMRNRQ